MNRDEVGASAVEDATDVPGLSFRNLASEDDYSALCDVYNRSHLGYGRDDHVMPLDTFRHSYGATANHDPYKDLIIAELDGEVVGYIRLANRLDIDGTHVYFLSMPIVPEWREKGIDRALLRAAEARAREIQAGYEDGSSGIFSMDAHNIETDLKQLLESEGYEAVRYEFEMETPDLENIPDAPLPEGLEVRPAVPAEYMKIIRASVEAFRDEWGAVEMSDADIERWLKNPQHQPELWVVAWDGSEVAGSILNFIKHDYNERTGRRLGYTEFISVGRPWRKRGLARAMLARSMHVLKEAGMTQTALGVDTENLSGALRLYEGMGYRVVSGGTTYRKGVGVTIDDRR